MGVRKTTKVVTILDVLERLDRLARIVGNLSKRVANLEISMIELQDRLEAEDHTH